MARKKHTDADRLREYLARACLSPSAFAREIGYSARMVQYMLSGEHAIERVVMLAAEHLADCDCTRYEREQRQGWAVERLARFSDD